MTVVTTLRIDEELHAELTEEAEEREMSLSEYLRRLLETREPAAVDADEHPTPLRDELEELRAELKDHAERLADLEREPAAPDRADHAPPPEEEPNELEGVDSIADLLEGWPGARASKQEQRRRAGRAALEWLRERGEATAEDFRTHVEPEQSVDGQSAATWWKKSARPALSRGQDAGLVEFIDGHKVYRWVGDAETDGSGENATVEGGSLRSNPRGDAGESGVYDPTEEFE